MSDKELKRVLQEIKDDCRKRVDCQGCIFDTKYGCRLDDVPNEWDLIGITDNWHKLYSWLVDLRFDLAPDAIEGLKEFTIKKEKVELMNHIIEYMNQLEEEDDET